MSQKRTFTKKYLDKGDCRECYHETVKHKRMYCVKCHMCQIHCKKNHPSCWAGTKCSICAKILTEEKKWSVLSDGTICCFTKCYS